MSTCPNFNMHFFFMFSYFFPHACSAMLNDLKTEGMNCKLQNAAKIRHQEVSTYFFVLSL